MKNKNKIKIKNKIINRGNVNMKEIEKILKYKKMKREKMKLSKRERRKIEKIRRYREMCERISWGYGLVGWKIGCDDSNNGMLSSKVKVGKLYYCKRDRRK